MKKRTFFKLLMAAAAALCLAAVLFLNAEKQAGYETQSVSFVVEHFTPGNETQPDQSAALPRETSAPKEEGYAGNENAADAGFDLADTLPPADLYLEKIKDFQADVERAAAEDAGFVPD